MANDYFASKGWLTKYAKAEDSTGAWQKYVAEVQRSEMDNFNTPDLDQGADSILRPGETLEDDFDVTFRKPNAEGGRQGFYKGSSAVESHGAKIIELAEAGESSVSIAKKLGLKQQTVNSAINAIENGLAGTEYKFSKPFKEIVKLSVNQHGAKLNEADKQAVKKLIKENPEKYFNQKETIKFLGKKRAILVPADEYPKPGKVWSNKAEKLRNEADKAWTKKYSNISIEDK